MENEKNDRAMHRKARKKVCHFCVDRVEAIDYKDVARLRKFISERAKILPRRVTGRSSARADHRYQACASDSSSALCKRLRLSQKSPLNEGDFLYI